MPISRNSPRGNLVLPEEEIDRFERALKRESALRMAGEDDHRDMTDEERALADAAARGVECQGVEQPIDGRPNRDRVP
ncbi:hypothetical protein AALP_AAs41607U000400 [Arabis alpina]|uniref:Uncharacterized protein n=1 Tax=Arabis alpina TaxID=50452 RepID=A0A087G1R7_ARAAL|nr:hypothetical protein AALP_AAs41607U000400 [Arabis alpina]